MMSQQSFPHCGKLEKMYNFYIKQIQSTLKPQYDKPRYSEFRDIANKTQLLF